MGAVRWASDDGRPRTDAAFAAAYRGRVYPRQHTRPLYQPSPGGDCPGSVGVPTYAGRPLMVRERPAALPRTNLASFGREAAGVEAGSDDPDALGYGATVETPAGTLYLCPDERYIGTLADDETVGTLMLLAERGESGGLAGGDVFYLATSATLYRYNGPGSAPNDLTVLEANVRADCGDAPPSDDGDDDVAPGIVDHKPKVTGRPPSPGMRPSTAAAEGASTASLVLGGLLLVAASYVVFSPGSRRRR